MSSSSTSSFWFGSDSEKFWRTGSGSFTLGLLILNASNWIALMEVQLSVTDSSEAGNVELDDMDMDRIEHFESSIVCESAED